MYLHVLVTHSLLRPGLRQTLREVTSDPRLQAEHFPMHVNEMKSAKPPLPHPSPCTLSHSGGTNTMVEMCERQRILISQINEAAAEPDPYLSAYYPHITAGGSHCLRAYRAPRGYTQPPGQVNIIIT